MAIERITGIVIDTVRHSDRHNIVTMYTRQRGRMSFLSNVGGGKSARMRNTRLQPLAVITADVNIRANSDLQRLGNVTPAVLWRDLYFNPVKASIVMFLSEFLNAFLRQAEADTALWDFIARSLLGIDREPGSVANRHLAFLIGLLPHAGIQPDLSHEGKWFDMREGVVTDFIPLHRDIITGDELTALRLLSRMTAANCGRFRFSAPQRRRILNGLLHYYSIHYPGLSNLKSPAILAETFS